MDDRKFTLILCGSGWGAPDQRTAFGPQELYDSELQEITKNYDFQVVSSFYNYPGYVQDDVHFNQEGFKHLLDTELFEALQYHAFICEQVVKKGRFPIVLGGDHSIAIGTWSGIRAANQNKEFGLMWLDAHMDAHTPNTTPSNALHGMPVAVLLGHGDENLVNLYDFQPKIHANRVAMIGIRDFEEGEALLLNEQSVKVFNIESVHESGFEHCFNESLKITKGDNGYYGISLDVDALDPQYVPGTGTPVQDGLSLAEVLSAFKGIAHDPNCTGIEITEINLEKDHHNITRQSLHKLIQSILEK